MKVCKVEGCGKKHAARGFCFSHLYQFKKGALDIEPDEYRRVNSYGGVECSVPDCGSSASDKGMCGKHAQRQRRYGDPSHITPEETRRANNREAQLRSVESVKSTTYRKYMGRHEHRRVAEEKIGRKLLPGEVVHHEDENKHNNHPDNLVVFPSQAAHAAYHARKNNAN